MMRSALRRGLLSSAPRTLTQTPRRTLTPRRAYRPPTTTFTRTPPARRSLSLALPKAAAPPAHDKAVAYWLFGCGGLVAGMVSVGGLTRLTRSGLSMTDWKLQGGLPPSNRAEWEREFQRYKQYPEWQQRKSMTLDEFKYIYAWEYGHRMLGRVVGLAFGLPLAYFWTRGRLTPWLKPRALGLLGLGGCQGLVGWWMVRSGLNTDLLPERQKQDVRVSPYRLATHLTMAFVTYSGLIWCGLETLGSKQAVGAGLKHAAKLTPIARGAACLTLVTAISGAFVAGNDAGMAFNVWPYMVDDRDVGGAFAASRRVVVVSFSSLRPFPRRRRVLRTARPACLATAVAQHVREHGLRAI